MGSIRLSDTMNTLFLDFRYQGRRCREYTLLPDTPANRKKLEKVLAKIEAEIAAGTFDYASYFPNSKALKRVERVGGADAGIGVPATGSHLGSQSAGAFAGTTATSASEAVGLTPLFKDFADQWINDHSIEWRRSHTKSVLSTLRGRLLPTFGDKAVGAISKSDVLAFRATLAKVKGRGQQEGLSPKRINEIMGLLRQIMSEAADRFQFTTPTNNIKKLRQRKTDVQPFSLTEVQKLLATVRSDYRDYFITRFFTGMRTGEAHGLKWKYVDFELRIIRVRETFVLGEDEYTKTDGSQRDIQMSQPVWEALQRQYQATGSWSEYVFCNQEGKPLDNKNLSDRVWYPLLRNLGLEQRRPYQMRHTAATLWLASGEAPEWIARQLGHTSTEMLFRVYSRYVPNLTRQDGSAMERLLASQLSQGVLLPKSTSTAVAKLAPKVVPKPSSDTAVRTEALFVPAMEVKAPPRSPTPITWEAMAVSWQGGAQPQNHSDPPGPPT